MKEFFRTYWVPFLVVALFVILKMPYLSYPYYWDESWPYAPAISAMAHNSISLHPAALDPELSRGHPLFFHALAALWMRVFGPGHIAMHSFALAISALFLAAIYHVGLRLFNKRVAIGALLLVATQAVFFVQSSFVLMEVLTALLAFVCIYFYTRDRYLLAAASLTMLFFTKESGLILGFVLGIHALFSCVSLQLSLRTRIYRLLAIGLPCMLIAVFFFLQWQARGWLIFPDHSQIIEHSWQGFWYKLRMGAIKDVFYNNLKFWYYIPLLLLAIAAAVLSRNLRYLAILLPAFCIYYFVDDMRAGRLLPGIPFFIVFLLAIAYFLYTFTSLAFAAGGQQRKFIALSGAFIICFLCFSALNFITYRYLLAALIPLLFITVVILDVFATATWRVAYITVIAIFIGINAIAFWRNDGYGDTDPGAYAGMDVQQATITWLVQNNAFDQAISSGSFLDRLHLTNIPSGFLHGSRIFSHVRWDMDGNTAYAMFNSLEPDSRYEQIKKDTSFHLAYRVSSRGVWAEIYKHNKLGAQ